MLKVVSFKICPFVQRVTALLEAKGVPYEVEYIELSEKPDWFLAISPHGQVPVLIAEDGRAIFESDAISEYVDEVAGHPLSSPDPVKKAQDRAWSALAGKLYLPQCGAMRSRSAEALEDARASLAESMMKIEARLGDGPYADGEKPGMVDIAWISILHRFDIIDRHSGYDFLRGFPKLKRWQAALLDTGIAQKAVSADFEARFADFYLAPETYVGQLKRKRAA